MDEKPSYFHGDVFNVSIIIAFFKAFVGAIVIVTVAGIHSLGVAAGEELSRYAPAAPKVEAPKPRPTLRVEGVPVAFRSRGIAP